MRIFHRVAGETSRREEGCAPRDHAGIFVLFFRLNSQFNIETIKLLFRCSVFIPRLNINTHALLLLPPQMFFLKGRIFVVDKNVHCAIFSPCVTIGHNSLSPATLSTAGLFKNNNKKRQKTTTTNQAKTDSKLQKKSLFLSETFLNTQCTIQDQC